MKRNSLLGLVLAVSTFVFADRIEIWQNHGDALYRVGEEAKLRVTVLDDSGAVRHKGKASWTFDNFGSVKVGAGEVDLAKENPFFVTGTLNQPDFLRLVVKSGKVTRNWSVGFDVEKIRQKGEVPADFDSYWQGEKERLAREVPLDPACELVSKKGGHDVYKVSFATFNNRRIWGYMSIPTNKALYPARVRIRVCDAGYGCMGPWEANDGEITATLSVHAFEPAKTLEAQKALLAEQNRQLGEKWNLPTNRYNTAVAGITGNRGDHFFHDAMLGIARGVDWIVARPEADPTRVTYFGSSQGGGFGLYVTYLNGHFTKACFAVPAITGHFGEKSRRQNGWPNMLSSVAAADRAKAEANLPYYDGVNFASRITIPVRFIVGFSDTTCPPPDVYAAYNVCPSKDKAILNGIGCTHCRENGWIGWLREHQRTNPLFDYNGWLREPHPKKTRIQLWFDTEDYVNPSAWDAQREIAKIMTEEGVRGNFNVVGYLGKVLVDNRRFDVIDALKKHVIGTQTTYHSWHPNLTEMTDVADYDEAYHRALASEAEGYGMLRAAFGLDRLIFSCYPGNGSSYVGLDVHSDLGAVFHGGLGAFGGKLLSGDRVWYQNLRQIDYNSLSLQWLGIDFDISEERLAAALEKAAKKDAVVFYMHPCRTTNKQFWDGGRNLRYGNWADFGHWIPCDQVEPELVKHFYERFRAFIRRLKNDPRFEITDCEKLVAANKPRFPITKKEIPAIRKSLLKELGPVNEPASWSVADCFQAAVRLLRGEESHLPGKVYGFLEKPVGVAAPTKVKAADLRAAAKKIVFKRHLSVSYDVGGVKLGPADFLFAALEVLETGAEEVVVTPRDQLGALKEHLPHLVDFSHAGTWCYVPEFKDRYLSDRLRWQFWTMRYE